MKRVAVEVAVIGAGVAGLAAARELRRAMPRLELLVLEARDRIGGRLYTLRENGIPVPIELGAEFIHGSASETIAVAEGAGLLLCDVRGDRWSAHAGRLTRMRGFWHRLDKVLRRLDAERTPDRSFREFIDSRPGGRALARERTLALEFVEGFHAAAASRISERSLAQGGSPGEDPNEQRMARVLDGYDGIASALAESVLDVMQLRAVVSRIDWRRGEVRVTVASGDGGEPTEVRARAAVITVPLGVLLAPLGERGAIAFEPAIDPVLQHARQLVMGSVVRIVLELRERIWENGKLLSVSESEALCALSFLHTRDPDIPVWWTAHPIRAPLLVGWAGGPRAARMLRRPPDEIERLAIASLARQLGLTAQKVRGLVQRSWTHNWDQDPFARGAYSYIGVGGVNAPRQLAQAVDGTLFFAGEAADPEGRMGTVNGAIATGVRAAKACLRAYIR